MTAMAVMTVVGARPQFIKAAPVSRAMAEVGLIERLVHTGQHYDAKMSDVFFAQTGLPAPFHHLGVGSGTHGAQTGRMLELLEALMIQERPAMVIVYGDTNSTLAGALAAAKLNLPVAHVEAGLRSFNRQMPEETNRVISDHLASLLFAPTDTAVKNLKNEGIEHGVYRTGDVMYDAFLLFRSAIAAAATEVCHQFGVRRHEYAFATIHRAENTDDEGRWRALLQGLEKVAQSGISVVWPVHPRVRERLAHYSKSGIYLIEPQPYIETQALLMNARVVLTDSGGLQKEAAFHHVPCVTLRNETEWVELVEAGVNTLAGTDPERTASLAAAGRWPAEGLPVNLYGDGTTSRTIAERIRGFLLDL